MPTVQHREYLNTVYTQFVFVMLILLASASKIRMTTPAEANRTSMTNTYCCVYSAEILLMMDSGHARIV